MHHLGSVAFAEVIHDECVRVGESCRLLDLSLRGGAKLAIADVLSDGALEEDGLLRHQPKLRAQPPHVERLDVDAVQQHGATLRVVEALEQLDDCRLARTRRATQRDSLTSGDGE